MRRSFLILLLLVWPPAICSAQDSAADAKSAATALPANSKAAEETAAGQNLDAPYLVRVREIGAWRAGALTGRTIYSIDGEKVGTANDIIVGKDGRVAAVVIDVGGYLGIAAKSVALKIGAFEAPPGATQKVLDDASARHPKAAPDPNAAALDTKGTSGGSGGNPAMDGNDGAVKLGPDGLPERLIARVTRQQLEEAPQLE